MGTHDVVVVGGGHNGLVVAAYLAKAGVDVCVVEKQDKVGGGVITRELTLPGFKHDMASTMHGMISANPLIHRDELGLISKYGLKYIIPDPQLAVVFPDDRALIIYRDIDKTCESIEQFSRRDAEMYPKFIKFCERVSRAAGVATFSPPPTFGAMVSFLDKSEEGREFLRIIMSSVWDIVEEWFESDELKIAISRFGTELMIGPREKGTGNGIFGFALFHRWGWNLPVGGSGALSEALEACIRDNGGTIKVLSPVKSIKVEAGEAKGVILETGEEITARKAVISNLNVKQLFLEMLRPDDLPTGFQDKVRRIKHCTFMPIHQAIALNEAPKYKAGGDVDRTCFVDIALFKEDYLRFFDDLAYGIPRTEMPLLGVATLVDPTRAPNGKHTLYLYHFEPYNLKDGGPAKWDEIKHEIADGVLEAARSRTTNLWDENILGRWIFSPLDFERYNPAWVCGDFLHMGSFLTQLFGNRPLPGWNYRTPIKKLYMCGPSTHPGGGASGGGRAAVQVIMEDLGISFRKVIGK